MQRAQQDAKSQTGRRLRLPTSRRFYTLASIPLVLVLALGVVFGPTAYQAVTAYRDVFVDSPSRDSQPIAVVNAEGTAVLATVAPEEAAIADWDGQDRVTILLLGVDRRTDEPARTDTMILVNIDPQTKKAGMISLPRDMKVFVPGYGVHKINAAYAFGDANKDKEQGGGPGLTIRTVEANFGIRINYFAEVDFQGFINIVNTVGGVTVDVPYPIKDDAYPASGDNYMRVYFPAGWQHMNGERALEYARTRHDDGDGHRNLRQQQVLLALRQQAVSLDLLPKAQDLLRQVGKSFRTDLSPTQVLQLGRLASQISTDNIAQYSLESSLTAEELPDQPYFLVPDWQAVGEIMSDFTGQNIVPPASILANPDLSVPIRIENGSGNPGLASRVAQQLRANGYTHVSFGDDGAVAYQDTTTITDAANDLATSMAVAGAIGVNIESITVKSQPSTPTPVPAASPAASPSASAKATAAPKPVKRTPDKDGIVIVLGADAPDPAYYSADPVSEDGSTAPAPIEEVPQSEDGG
ncbi:MAG: LCP family protein [Thermomicrobiales bacterium]